MKLLEDNEENLRRRSTVLAANSASQTSPANRHGGDKKERPKEKWVENEAIDSRHKKNNAGDQLRSHMEKDTTSCTCKKSMYQENSIANMPKYYQTDNDRYKSLSIDNFDCNLF